MSDRDFYQVSLKVFLINDKDQILALKAHNKGSYSGFYDFPGGRIDRGEFTTSFEEIIRREIQEEVGNIKFSLDANPVALGRHLIPASEAKGGVDIHVLYIFFKARYISGEIIISEEHNDVMWFNPKTQDPKNFFKSGNLEGIEAFMKLIQ